MIQGACESSLPGAALAPAWWRRRTWAVILGSLPLAAQAQFELMADVTKVASGSYHSCALTSSGGVKCWGANANRQLGDGTGTSRTTPARVYGLSQGVVSIAAGEFHTCALMADTTVKCWGLNSNGQLGDGTTVVRATPVAVTGLTGVNRITAGRFHTCATTSAAAYCWGDNEFGQLGDGSTTDRTMPIAVSGLAAGVMSISAAHFHTCAVHIGVAKCWGRNAFGQLGDGTTTARSTADAVAGLGTDIQMVAAATYHSCALTSGGAVLCWGFNGDGEIGDGSTMQRLTPVPVSGLDSGVSVIYAGFAHSCAIVNGGAKCWGYNNKGQLGDGGTVNGLVPSDVIGLVSGVQSLAPRFEHTCAVVSGLAQCWGSDERGQLGSNGAGDALTATSVLVNIAEQVVDTVTPDTNADSVAAASDATGRYVTFQSKADFAGVPNTSGTPDIYLVDTQAANAPVLISRSTGENGAPLAGAAIEPSISADGQLVAFVAQDQPTTKLFRESPESKARRAKGAGTWSVVMRNLVAGTTQSMTIPALAGGAGTSPRLSASGNALVYTAPNQGAGGGSTEVFKVPLTRSGDLIIPGTPQCVSCKGRNADGTEGGDSDGASTAPVVSVDGRFVAWQTQAKNLVPGPPSPCPNAQQIVLADLLTGINQRIATPASAGACGAVGASKPEMDWSGRKIVFETDQPLSASDAGVTPDVYLVDLGANRLQRVSQTLEGTSPDGASTAPRISGDGNAIAFVSAATDLDRSESDTNARPDVHVRSLRFGETFARRLSKTRDGAESDGDSDRPALNYNGTRVAFDSTASNLAPGATPGVQQVFQRASPADAALIFAAGFD